MTEAIGQARSLNYRRQVRGSVLFKGLAIAASFIAIPLTIRYLGAEQYGVWSTLLAITSWIMFFDLGIGNGLRNKLAEALAHGNLVAARQYLTSAYAWIGLISLAFYLLLAGAALFVPWQRVFNAAHIAEQTLLATVLITAFFVFLNFWLGLISQVLNAVQRTSWVVLGQFFANVAGLAVVYILAMTTEASLIYLALGYGLAIVSANLLLSGLFYFGQADLQPGLSFERALLQPLLSVGLQFFVIQLAVLVLFTTDKILITQLFGPEYIVQYDAVFKLFSIMTLVHGLVTAPLWSSYTDAYHRQDFAWIKRALHKQLYLFAAIVLATLVLGLASRWIICLWISATLDIPWQLIVAMGCFIVVSTWNNIFAYFLNGIGETRGQLMTALVAMTINIPLALFFTKVMALGTSGIVLATCVSLLIFAVFGPLQTYAILADHQKDKTLNICDE